MDVRRLVEEAEAYGRTRDVVGNIIRDNVGSIIPGIKTLDPYQSIQFARPELVEKLKLPKSDPRDNSEISPMKTYLVNPEEEDKRGVNRMRTYLVNAEERDKNKINPTETYLFNSEEESNNKVKPMRFAGVSGNYMLKERDPSNKVERLPDKTYATPLNIVNPLFSNFSEKVKRSNENVTNLYNLMQLISGTGGNPMTFASEGGEVTFSPQGNIGFRTSEIPGNPYVSLNPANKEASIMFAPEQNPLNPQFTLGINPQEGFKGAFNFSTRF